MNTKELLREKRVEILKIAAQYGGSNVRIFGSVARGEATADSDIALIQELEDVLGCKVDVAKPEILHESIREQVLQEAVPL